MGLRTQSGVFKLVVTTIAILVACMAIYVGQRGYLDRKYKGVAKQVRVSRSIEGRPCVRLELGFLRVEGGEPVILIRNPNDGPDEVLDRATAITTRASFTLTNIPSRFRSRDDEMGDELVKLAESRGFLFHWRSFEDSLLDGDYPRIEAVEGHSPQECSDRGRSLLDQSALGEATVEIHSRLWDMPCEMIRRGTLRYEKGSFRLEPHGMGFLEAEGITGRMIDVGRIRKGEVHIYPMNSIADPPPDHVLEENRRLAVLEVAKQAGLLGNGDDEMKNPVRIPTESSGAIVISTDEAQLACYLHFVFQRSGPYGDYGRLLRSSSEQQIQFLQRRAGGADDVAQYVLGIAFLDGLGVSRQPGAGIALLQAAGGAGNQAAIARLVQVLGSDGPPDLRNPELHKYWAERLTCRKPKGCSTLN